MGKRILAVVAGIAVALALVSGTDMLAGKLFPPPAGIDFNDKEAIKQMIASMPLNAFLLLLLGYAIASFTGGVVATLIARDAGRAALIAGSVVTIGGIMNLVFVPHPIWFAIINVPEYLVFAYLGYLVSKRKAVI